MPPPTPPTPPPPRPIHRIAREILRCWPKPSQYATPYLHALITVSGPNDLYGSDSARDLIDYFLANASSFRGPDARRLKAELNRVARS